LYDGSIAFYEYTNPWDRNPVDESLLIKTFEDGASILTWDSTRSDEVGQPVYQLTITEDLLEPSEFGEGE
jgi:hypothetical protein